MSGARNATLLSLTPLEPGCMQIRVAGVTDMRILLSVVPSRPPTRSIRVPIRSNVRSRLPIGRVFPRLWSDSPDLQPLCEPAERGHLGNSSGNLGINKHHYRRQPGRLGITHPDSQVLVGTGVDGTATGVGMTCRETPPVLGFLALGCPPSLHFPAEMECPEVRNQLQP